MNDALHKIEERELRDNGSNANTMICPRFEPLALRPRLHREGFLIHYLVHRGLPPREPPPRRIREYRTPLSTNNLHRGKYNHHLNKRGRPLAKQPQSTSPRGIQNQSPTPPHQEGVNNNLNLNLYQRGSTHKERVYNLVVSFNHKQFLFPQNKDPNRIG